MSDPAYASFVSQFTTTQKPDLKWEDTSLPWNEAISGSTEKTYQLGEEDRDPTSRTGTSRIIRLNRDMLNNSSQLLITATAS